MAHTLETRTDDLSLAVRGVGLTLENRKSIHLPARLLLEIGADYWLFEDSTYIMLEAGDVGTTDAVLPDRSVSLKLEECTT